MTSSVDPKSASAYTRASVEAYLQAAAAERARIELAIAEARARTERALGRAHRLHSLEVADSAATADADLTTTSAPHPVGPTSTIDGMESTFHDESYLRVQPVSSTASAGD
jgi:hypothetical protein